MSAAKRIELGNDMLERFQASNCGDHKAARFVSDMIVRLERGKSMTPKQRAWYDEAVLSSPPKPKNEEQVAILLSAAEVPGMEKVSKVLKDFAYKLGRGWKLSEKQTAFMNKLLEQASDIKTNGRWEPSEEEKKQIAIGLAFSARYTADYLYGCPGISAALKECDKWLRGEITHVDKWYADKIMNLCKGDRKALADAADRWPQGSLATTKQGKIGLVVNGASVSKKGKPCLVLLLDGNPTEINLSDMKKQRRKNKS